MVGRELARGRRNARPSERREHRGVVVRALGGIVERDRLAVKLGEAHLGAGGERVSGRHRREHGLVLEPLCGELAGNPDAEPDREVEPAGADVVEQRPRRLLADVQAQPPVALAHGVEERLEAVPGAGGEPDGERPGLPAARGLGGGERVVDRAQGGAGGLEQRLAGLGELDAAGGAVQQRHAELLLQARDRGAERLLGDVHPPRGAREVQLLGHRDEVAQVAQLDIHSRGV